MKTWKLALLFSTLVGLLDSATGLLLIIDPKTALTLMLIDPEPYQLVLISFIGGFVFAVGSLYVIATRFANNPKNVLLLKHLWYFTGWLRICICATTGYLIFKGTLPLPWITVTLADGAIALIQFTWISTSFNLIKEGQ